MDFSKLIYLPINIPNPPNITEYLDSISTNDMIVDKYRTCHHIPIMDESTNYTTFGKELSSLADWLEDYVFPWTARSRIRILRTMPFSRNAPHIDCSPKKFLTVQHKFRYVFQGKVDTLKFLHDDTNTAISALDKPYIMDGAWPHEMYNDTTKVKYTLALGAPWEPSLTDIKYLSILQNSYKEYHNYYIDSTNWSLPADFKNLFESRYSTELSVLDHI